MQVIIVRHHGELPEEDAAQKTEVTRCGVRHQACCERCVKLGKRVPPRVL